MLDQQLGVAVALAQAAAAETKVKIGFTGLSDIVPVFAAGAVLLASVVASVGERTRLLPPAFAV